MYRRLLTAVALAGILASAALAAPDPLLSDAVENWLGERDHWAFTQKAVEHDRDGSVKERLERYDPSQPGNGRWQLLAIDGQPPTPGERAEWEKKKFRKKPRRFDSPLGDLFDFERARLLDETSQIARFKVPLRSDKSWLFPVDKVDVTVSVDKRTHALENLTANVREPFKVLLGIARITNGSVDLTFDEVPDSTPASARPTGTAHVSFSRFGERIDFTWSEFKRVTPHRDRLAEAGATKRR